MGNTLVSRKVQYQVYNGAERLSSQLIATMDMSYYSTTYTSGAPSNASFILGVQHKTKDPIFTISNFKTPVQSTRNVAFVGVPKDLLFNETTSTLSFGLESVTASDTANTNVYAMVSTRDLYYDTHNDDLSGYLKEIASLQDSLTPILTVSAGATVNTSAYQRQPAITGGWVLISRGVVGQTPLFDLEQNIASDENNFDVNFSRLYDLKYGQGLLTDADIKINSKYKFRLIFIRFNRF